MRRTSPLPEGARPEPSLSLVLTPDDPRRLASLGGQFDEHLRNIEDKLGIALFVQIIVTNCVILARAEAFASRNPPGRALADALGTAAGFAIALLALGTVREALGRGTLLAGMDQLFGPAARGWAIDLPVIDGGLLLVDRTRCWSDVAALAVFDPVVPAGDDVAALCARADRLLHLVPGPLLEGLDAPWALAERERARRRFVLALAPIAERLEAQAPREACRLYERALQADPLAESLSRRLIALQLAQGQRAEALRAWHHCKAMLALHGEALSDESVALARQAAFPL